MTDKNIHPVFHKILNQEDKERMLNQRSRVIWLVGLSGAGKTTLARNIEMELNGRGFLTQILDGDNIRMGLNNNLTFSEEDRTENIRRIAEVSKLFLNCGIICINAFITPTRKIREQIFQIIGRSNVIEIFVNAPVEVCERRDTKGLYSKARKGLIRNFTGIDSPFEDPVNPDLEIKTHEMSVSESVERCLEIVLPGVTY